MELGSGSRTKVSMKCINAHLLLSPDIKLSSIRLVFSEEHFGADPLHRSSIRSSLIVTTIMKRRNPGNHCCNSLSACLALQVHLAVSMYSALGFSYLAQKNRPLFRASQVQNLLSSSFNRATDCASMLVCAIISGRLTVAANVSVCVCD